MNTGFKQESGQFFTPVPLVRFMLKSLPIKEVIEEKIRAREANFLPKIIDFSCGSGHFLTESMDIVQDALLEIDTKKLTPAQEKKADSYMADEFGWAREYIYGIERDYRLAKTSKLASFMNGDGDAIIIHASGLDPFSSESYQGILQKKESMTNDTFDVLVANPPYAVKEFKQTIKSGSESFLLYDKLTDKSNEIEVLFVERMTQLVRPGGLVGIILPRSILNNGGVYEMARKMIFENFLLKAIAVLGGKSFMATGINTVILFMEKREFQIILEDRADYFDAFNNDQKLLRGGGVLVKSGEGEQEKRFLGYEFSSRKGSEGMKIRGDTLLLDEENLSSCDHVAGYIHKAMSGKVLPKMTSDLEQHIEVVPLKDLFDWESECFSNAMVFIERVNLECEHLKQLVSLTDAQSILESGKRPKGGVSEITGGIKSLGAGHIHEYKGEMKLAKMNYVSEEFYDSMKRGHVQASDILIAKDGAQTGKCAIFNEDGKHCVNEHLFIVRSIKEKCSQNYLFYFMMSSFFQRQVIMYAYNKKGQPGLNKNHMQKIKLFLPTIREQNDIVALIEEKWGGAVKKGERSGLVDAVFGSKGLKLI